MQIRNKISRTFIFLAWTLFLANAVNAQDVNTFYYMRGVPQVYQVNPAIQPDCNFFFGIPGLSPVKVQVDNDFGLEDVIQYDPITDSLVFFLHPNGIREEILDRLEDTNSFTADFSTSLFSLGFRVNKAFITLDIRERFGLNFDYSKDFLRFPMVGPADGEIFDINMGVDMTLFNEMSLGVSRKIGDKLTIGVRGKLLFGQANLNTSAMDIHLESSTDAILVENDFSINTSDPYLADYVAFASAAPIATITQDFDNFDIGTPDFDEIKSMVINPDNMGLAVDIGVDFRVFDWLQLNASVVDLGSINWKSGVVNLSNTSSYNFVGVHTDIQQDDFFDLFLDTLEMTFDNFTTTATKYKTALPTKVYAGVALHPLKFISFGALSRTDFYKGDIRQQFTFSTNIYPIRMLSTSFSYSIIDGTYKNLGLGIALKLLPLNIYLLTDTGPSIYFWPPEARMFNFKLGVNIMVGNPNKKNKRVKVYDVPLVD